MNKPEYIIIHHTATPKDKNPRTFDAVKRYHISKGWGDIGYHYFIESDGTLFNGRNENVAGAHCYQDNMNFKSIGICLEGNFDIEEPNKEQLKTLKELIKTIQVKYNIPDKNVLPHRKYATYKSCPGKNFTDKEINELLSDDMDIGFIMQWAYKNVAWVSGEGANGELFVVDKDGNLNSYNFLDVSTRELLLKTGCVLPLDTTTINKFKNKII